MILRNLKIEDTSRYVEISAEVIIKRDDKYYSVPARIRNDYDDPGHLVQNLKTFKDVLKQFMDICKRLDRNWKILDPEFVDGAAGFKISQEEVIW